MNSEPIKVNMLGDFSIRFGEQSISDSGNRMRKVWLLLAYLIHRGERGASPDDMTDLLWENGEEQANLQGSLKTMLYRTRTMLDKLGEGMGHKLILRRGSMYHWNREIPVELDVAEFERLYEQGCAAGEAKEKLDAFSRALALYRGEFLSRLSMESWVVPLAAYYHRLFLEMMSQTLLLMEQEQMWEEAAVLCRRGLKLEPYSEDLYCHLMRNHLAAGDQAAAVSTYEEMSELLFANFGVMPSEEARAIYRQAAAATKEQAVSVSMVREELKENGAEKGALFCEYDYFKTFYRLTARTIVRSGDTVHIAVLSVGGKGGKALSRKSLDKAMENLREITVRSLRQGDVVSQCSVSQLIVMLPQANYENSCMVCARILRAFYRQHPHSPADIGFSVQPLEPRLNL